MNAVNVPGPAGPGLVMKAAGWWGKHALAQIALICAVVALFWWLGANTVESMARIGIAPGFDFLFRSANFEIGESMIPFGAGDTYGRALLAGLLNTVKVALLGGLLATLLGVALGVARLSGNLLLANLVRWYVDVVRNTPLLLQLFFWSGLLKALPGPRQAISLLDAAFLTNRGVNVPAMILGPVAPLTLVSVGLILFLGIGATVLLWRTGRVGRALLAPPAALGLALLMLIFSGTTLSLDIPALSGFNIRGGWTLTPEFAALLIGLVVKFSANIAEIVRAGIESVTTGQWEAARSLGLHGGQIMRLVVLPQALRVITPMTTSIYLDLTKDSSLAVAIGYPDLVSVANTTANTTGQALESLAVIVVVFLSINLSIAGLMNMYNRRVALRGEGRR